MISVVVPCFNESEVIRETHRQLAAELEGMCARHGLRYEILFVDDGSRDATLSILHELADAHPSLFDSSRGQVHVLALSRNFGHQIALTAGMSHARGDAVVAIDADLQDPPAVIEQMIEKWKEGADVVFGVRSHREGESWFKKASASAFYRLVRSLTNVEIPLDSGDFRLMSRRAADAFNRMPERHRFVRGMVPWLGFRQVPVSYSRAARFAGTTKYPLSKMLRLAFDGITSFSSTPLKATYVLGFVVAVLCLGYIGVVLFERLATGTPVRGWSSLMAAILFLGSVQLITLGILGEYVGRIHDEVKGRPLYLVDEAQSRLVVASDESRSKRSALVS